MSNIEIIDSNHSAGVELVRSGDRWGVRIDDEIRWADGPIDAMRNYCEHVEADRELDATPSPRRPVAGWVVASPARRVLSAGHLTATFFPMTSSWQVAHHMYRCEYILASGDAEGEASQFAAEDALLGLLRPTLSALGYEVRRG